MKRIVGPSCAQLWLLAFAALTLGTVCARAETDEVSGREAGQNAQSDNQTSDPCEGNSSSPASFVEIREYHKDNSIILYDPRDDKHRQMFSPQMRANTDSLLEVRILKDKLPCDLDQLYISAKLDRGEAQDDALEVENYNVLGEDRDAMAAQRAVGFASVNDLESALETAFEIAKSVLRGDKDECPEAIQQQAAFDHYCDPTGRGNENSICKKAKESVESNSPDTACMPAEYSQIAPAVERNEAQAKAFIASLGRTKNVAVASIVGHEVLGIQVDTLAAFAAKYQEALTAFISAKNVQADQKAAANTLYNLTRVTLEAFYKGFYSWRAFCEQSPKCNANGNVLDYKLYLHKQIRKKLKDHLLPGKINLANQDANRGEAVTITVESGTLYRDSDGDLQSAQAKETFRIRLEKYGARFETSASLFFIKRIAPPSIPVMEEMMAAPNPGEMGGMGGMEGAAMLSPNRIRQDAPGVMDPMMMEMQEANSRFAPAPGATFQVTFRGRSKQAVDKDGNIASKRDRETRFYRENRTGWGKFLEEFAPGIGLNLSLLTFDDVTNGTFEGESFQLGVGPMISIFGGKAQATFGWNLQADQSRLYWGLGFDFLDTIDLFKKKSGDND